MIIASLSENKEIDKRISITPEIAKKYINLGFEIQLSENYGEHLGFEEKEYKELGVKFIKDDKKIIENADIIIQMSLLEDSKISLLKSNQTFIGILNPYENKKKIDELVKKKVILFSLELLPRITRAQSMDVLSSQANLAGYKAVIESFSTFEKAIPMMMTAAGTIPAAKVLIVGAGVAGLQAIATAKRMGAIVFATDVRMASKEQVESLGGKFLSVEGAENLETKGGYAKETSEEFKKKQEELLGETLKKIDIVICTALIPGKKAPLIIKENMLNNIIIRGIKNIPKIILRKVADKVKYKNAMYSKEETWVLDTVGTNLLDILSLDSIDVNRTVSNDIQETYNVLGIEAARQCIYNELDESFESDYINYHHLSMLADRMTATKKMVSIFRHGINNDNIGPIAKASFEETPEMFLRAAKHAELDLMTGISANIMCGQQGNFGTSSFDVLLDINKISELSSKTMESKDNIDSILDDVENSEDYCALGNINLDDNSESIGPKNTGNIDDDYDLGF